jgi:DNA polymerase-3 subunit gamma/tau
VDAVSARDAAAAFTVLEDLVQEGADLRQFLGEMLFDLRGALLARVGAEAAMATDFGPDESEWLRSVGQRWAPAGLAAALREFAELDAPGLDERQLLIRLELAVASVAGFAGDDAVVREPARRAPSGPPESGAPEPVASEARLTPPRGIRETTETPSPSAAAEPPVAAPALDPPTVEMRRAKQDQAVPGPGGAVPSLAVVQGRWQAVLDGYVGNLLDKVLLARVAPIALDAGVLTLGGPLDALELRQIESCRKAIEARLAAEFGNPLLVRFGADERPPAETTEPPKEREVSASENLSPARDEAEPDWPELPPDDHALAGDDDSSLLLVEAAARMFGGEIVPDAPEPGHASAASPVPYDDQGP